MNMKKSVIVLTAILALGVFAAEAVMLKPTAAYAAQTADAQEKPGNNANGGQGGKADDGHSEHH